MPESRHPILRAAHSAWFLAVGLAYIGLIAMDDYRALLSSHGPPSLHGLLLLTILLGILSALVDAMSRPDGSRTSPVAALLVLDPLYLVLAAGNILALAWVVGGGGLAARSLLLVASLTAIVLRITDFTAVALERDVGYVVLKFAFYFALAVAVVFPQVPVLLFGALAGSDRLLAQVFSTATDVRVVVPAAGIAVLVLFDVLRRSARDGDTDPAI